uniref:Uncharacterized protein n=1 Tax=Arundo donax TaxID=35708 RepID=A0A0A9EJS1_ARUDO
MSKVNDFVFLQKREDFISVIIHLGPRYWSFSQRLDMTVFRGQRFNYINVFV